MTPSNVFMQPRFRRWIRRSGPPQVALRPRRLLVLGALVLALLSCGPVVGRDLYSYALVQDDATLLISGRRVHLYGIYIPRTDRTCRGYLSPVRCAPRAALVLDSRIQGFVHCEEMSVNADGSINAICRVDRGHFSEGDDLAEYLITRGWALALPEAPFHYHALEKIARRRGLGVWGFHSDVVR